ncbi:MAG: peptidase T [Lachnospiraceae bacterium]|nr:peptidase T [Lachnospiraceae bacterium]
MSEVVDRFLTYVSYDTQSSEESQESPSTAKQHELAKVLAEELRKMGASDVIYDAEYCYVYAKIPATDGGACKKCLGFIAHMDTSPEVSDTDVKARIVRYEGGDIALQEDGSYVLREKDFPELSMYRGQSLIVTDGTTLLGADDKAGVAEIMTMANYLLAHPEIPHGPLAVAFTPDEEIGAGVDHFDTEVFGADYAYTVDGGRLGELEYECFNAAAVTVTIAGRSVHPGSAKGKMINASRVALELDAMIPASERPETTEGYEGFFHLTGIRSETDAATVTYIIRDHDRALFEEKKRRMETYVKTVNERYGAEIAHLTMKDSYYNMKEVIEQGNYFLVENAVAAMRHLGITPIAQPIRGGTDGARLSFMGVPCPNLCTGGENFHSRYEYVSADAMEKITEMLILLATGRTKE